MSNEKTFQPALRFNRFEGDWEELPLSQIALSFEYGLNASAVKYDGVHKYIRITDINDDTREFDTSSLTTPETNLALADSYKLEYGDLLFARTGASVGKTYYYKQTDGLVYYAGFLIRAKIKPDHDVRFIFQNTLTYNYEQFIKVMSQRSGQPGVNANEYGQFEIKIPGLKEQTKISTFFHNIDQQLKLHQSKHTKLQQLKKAMLGKMFPNAGAKVPKVRFAGFSGDWEEKSLGNIGNFTSGIGFPEIEQGGKSGVPYFKVSDLNLKENHYGMTTANNYVSNEQIKRLNYKLIKENSILFAKVGAAIFLERKRIAQNFLMDNNMMAFSTSLDIIFIKQWFDSIKLSTFSQVGALPSFNASDLARIVIKFPNRDEQTKIGNYFHNLDRLIALQQQHINKLKNIKQACLEKMFV